jgi:hypothetical protein
MQHACWDMAHTPVAIVASILWLFYAVGFPVVKDEGGEVIIMPPCLVCMDVETQVAYTGRIQMTSPPVARRPWPA